MKRVCHHGYETPPKCMICSDMVKITYQNLQLCDKKKRSNIASHTAVITNKLITRLQIQIQVKITESQITICNYMVGKD